MLQARLKKIIQILESVEDFSVSEIKNSLWEYASKEGRGSVLWPMRYILSGRDKSPDPFVLAEILGKEECIKRLNYAISKIESKN